jgi:hypothetical protein
MKKGLIPQKDEYWGFSMENVITREYYTGALLERRPSAYRRVFSGHVPTRLRAGPVIDFKVAMAEA